MQGKKKDLWFDQKGYFKNFWHCGHLSLVFHSHAQKFDTNVHIFLSPLFWEEKSPLPCSKSDWRVKLQDYFHFSQSHSSNCCIYILFSTGMEFILWSLYEVVTRKFIIKLRIWLLILHLHENHWCLLKHEVRNNFTAESWRAAQYLELE